MSVTNVKSCADVGARVEYLVVGEGAKRRAHLKAETHRMAAMSCDAGSIEDFVKQGRAWAKQHGRKVQALTYIQSFAKNELSAEKPEDINYCNELGAELARRMHPNSPALTITHTDGEGGKVHNHIVVLNHDMESGYALKNFKLHHQVAKVNDELMLDHGFTPVVEKTVAERGVKSAESTKHVTKARGFDAQLLEAVRGARGASKSFETFVEECKSRGIDVDVREDKGITYRMMDETGPKRRVRRRKASKLGKEFMRDELEKRFEKEKAKQQEPVRPAVPSILDGLDEAAGINHPLESVERMIAAKRAENEALARRYAQRAVEPDPKPDEVAKPEPKSDPKPDEVAKPVESKPDPKQVEVAKSDPVEVVEAPVEPQEPVQRLDVPEHEEKPVEQPKKPVRTAPRKAPASKRPPGTAPRKRPPGSAPQKRRPGSAPQKQVDDDDYEYW
ncbi:relaxase/mobilization nuclease domain-containing protein [Dermabacter vaginalis]|uniref:relaxase/mobilization nuclease domain-containing protein n=1 Tax=Dermabacter vaginalis TaxID=1630135 RepID=UPI0021A83998|nr:relaxase/mobilization nuclease domain-containing protein [Dermabacter vaginalis]MCT2149583.1 relaxase/mobilization nuclease domain-containing protein [Dermabacter vaginalis]